MANERKIISKPVPIFEPFSVKKEFGIKLKLLKIRIKNPTVKLKMANVKKKSSFWPFT
ncbi:hypothetical protein ADICYQ_3321 [Cyclobacterium qasimii M12-11B]|uniref:Uncharacterized protein n=1 Tax=Cyclobacterium qasimii M12-11B TaxID=641524 RepID=S7VCI1_9BACT|nr:hypothetical protein ADICYQ_3321 [Cyclobacterium qasimii M12-11B]